MFFELPIIQENDINIKDTNLVLVLPATSSNIPSSQSDHIKTETEFPEIISIETNNNISKNNESVVNTLKDHSSVKRGQRYKVRYSPIQSKKQSTKMEFPENLNIKYEPLNDDFDDPDISLEDRIIITSFDRPTTENSSKPTYMFNHEM